MSSSNDFFAGGSMEDTMLHLQQMENPGDLELAEGFLLGNTDWNWASQGGFTDDLSVDFFGHVPGRNGSPSPHQGASLPIRTTAQEDPHNPSPSVSTAETSSHTSPTEHAANGSAGFGRPSHGAQNASLPSLGTLTCMSISGSRSPMGAGSFGPAMHGDGAVASVPHGSNVPQQLSFNATSAATEDITDNMETEEDQDESEDQQDSEGLGTLLPQKRTPKPVTMIDGRPHFVPSISCLLNPLASGANTHTDFNGVEEVREYLRCRSVVAADPTIPRTDAQKKAIVCAMLNLVKNTEYALDNDKVVAPFENHKWSDKRIEASCWLVLDLAMDCHINGPILTTYNGSRPRHNFSTFAERMGHILEAIGMHKTICKHMMDPPYIYFLVDDPLCAQKRVRSNKALNQRKGAYMRAGQAILEPRTPRHHSRRPSPKSAKATAKTPRKSTPRKATPEKVTTPAVAHAQQSQSSATPANLIYPFPPQVMNSPEHQMLQSSHASEMTAPLASSGPVVSAPAAPSEPGSYFLQPLVNHAHGFGTGFGSAPFNSSIAGAVHRMTHPAPNPHISYAPNPAAQFQGHETAGNFQQFTGAMFNPGMMYPAANVTRPMMGAPVTSRNNEHQRDSLGPYQFFDGSPGQHHC